MTAVYYRDWMQKLRREMHNNRPDLLGDGPLILHDSAHPHLRKVVSDLLKYIRVGSVTSHAIQSRLESTGL